jgi:hypothetical protein
VNILFSKPTFLQDIHVADVACLLFMAIELPTKGPLGNFST